MPGSLSTVSNQGEGTAGRNPRKSHLGSLQPAGLLGTGDSPAGLACYSLGKSALTSRLHPRQSREQPEPRATAAQKPP